MAEQVEQPKSNEASLLESLIKIANSLDNGPIRQEHIAKFKAKTPWNPTGEPIRENLRRTVYMSGARLREILLSQDEIALLNKIKAGKYNERRWVVIERDGGGDGGAVDIIVPNKTQEDRIRLMGEAPDLKTLLTRIVTEYEANEAPKSKRA